MKLSHELSEIWKSCKLILFIILRVRSNKTNSYHKQFKDSLVRANPKCGDLTEKGMKKCGVSLAANFVNVLMKGVFSM